MKWQKLGRIFMSNGNRPWMQSHASNPVVLPISDDLIRIYFACRDVGNRSHVGFVEIGLDEPGTIRRIAEEPALAPGPLGYFDDHGVYPSSIVRQGRRLLLYYIGWNPGLTPPLFYTSVGVAVSEDGGESFQRIYRAPILGRSEIDPWMVSAPWVLYDGGEWRMWYISGIGWEEAVTPARSYYHIKYATSADGIRWAPTGLVCLDLRPGEFNIARACVLNQPDGYQAWYSYAGDRGYRIGFAVSDDGLVWTRRDELAGIDVSPHGWDSEAQAYPLVFLHGGRRYMIYSGNGFGRAGIGLAVEDARLPSAS